MSNLSSKYCGCTSTSTCSSCSSCCSSSVQTAPTACCEAHKTVFKTGLCLRVTCTTVAATGTFTLTFSNAECSDIPINANEVFLYHAGAGLMQITGFDGISYYVTLVNQAKAGIAIQPDDCILVSVQTTTGVATLNTRCLDGNFTPPAVNGDATIYILNGSGIPIGATITFTYNGETGSYVVKSYVGATNNIYTYVVTNTGSGHTPGILIEGDCDGGCTVPIEVISDVDVCNLSESQTVDNLTGCLNGSPRAFVSVGEDYVPVGDGDGGWTQQKLPETDCCVIIDGCLKFSGNTCPDGSDQVILQDTGIECFEAAYDEAVAADQNLPVIITGGGISMDLVVTDYVSGTQTVTVTPADPTALAELVEFPAGSQICLGDCCNGCLNGPQITNHKLTGQVNPEEDAVVSLSITQGEIDYGAGLSYWLMGYDQAGVVTVLELDAAYFAAPAAVGPRLPKIDDPLVFREKICNTSPVGCDQRCEVNLNFELFFNAVAAGDTVDWEVAHYAGPAATLADGVTPNPFSIVSTKNMQNGRITGATDVDGTMDNTQMGFGGTTEAKVFPFGTGTFNDYIELRKCDCALSVVWFFFRINAAAPGTMNAQLTIRRVITKIDWNLISIPLNDYDSENFAV